MTKSALTHPLDAFLRQRLDASVKADAAHQKEIAKMIGRSPSWLSKYISGAGKATADDAIRLTAIVVLGISGPPLTRDEWNLLRDWRTLAPAQKRYVKHTLSVMRANRPGPRSGSSGRAE